MTRHSDRANWKRRSKREQDRRTEAPSLRWVPDEHGDAIAWCEVRHSNGRWYPVLRVAHDGDQHVVLDSATEAISVRLGHDTTAEGVARVVGALQAIGWVYVRETRAAAGREGA